MQFIAIVLSQYYSDPVVCFTFPEWNSKW